MATRKTTDRTLATLAVVGSLVLVNILGVGIFTRLDLTRDRQFTLSGATQDTLRRLTDPVTVRAYFTEDAPPQEAAVRRYVQDLLEEYYIHGDGYFRYEFIDPAATESEEDKKKKKDVKRDIFGRAVREATAMERELMQQGIQARNVGINEGDKLEVKRVYSGLVIRYREESEVIPAVVQTAGLEYDLTTLVRKLTRAKTPKVGIVTSHGGSDVHDEVARLSGLLQQLYEVARIDLQTETTIADDVDAVVVVGPKEPFSEDAKKALDTFVQSGRSAAFFLDTVKPDMRRLQSEPANHGLDDLLGSYGVRVEKALALDTECAPIQVQTQQGFMRIAQPVRYPFLPVVKTLDEQHPVSRGIGQVVFPFTSPLEITLPEDSSVEAEVLARTSKNGWLVREPYDLDPLKRWTQGDVGEQASRNLLVTLSGPLKSPYGLVATTGDDNGESGEAVQVPSRVMVAGGASFVSDQFLTQSNQALVLNVIDWLVLDEALLAVRSRGLRAAPIDELSEATRASVKWGHVFGLPLLLVAFGIVRWRLREARRSKVTL